MGKMFRSLAAASLVIACCAAPFNSELDRFWQIYKQQYNKQFNELHDLHRRSIWEKNLVMIQEHNLQADLGMHTYTLGMNQYSDMTNEEFTKVMSGYRQSNYTRKGSMFVAPSNVNIPDEVDWRKEGYVTPVKDQGQCRSSWAFSATGSLEGQHFKKTGKLVSLSEQNLIDCATSEGNLGCKGGGMELAFIYIKDNGGIDTEESYPYQAEDMSCRFLKSNVGATVTGFTVINQGDEEALKQAVASVGPVSVAIDASSPKFQSYSSGIYDDPSCSSERVNRGMLVVGYGTSQGKDYWFVKNSWGKAWGMDGYIMMSRNKNNQCGIANQASYPLV